MIVKNEKGDVIIDSDNPSWSVKPQKGYHIAEIPKGTLGEISKIEEELAELKDAETQGIKIMVMVELSDVYGALEFYAEKQGLTMEDVKKFSDLNKKVKSEQ